jgi:hypothetical protein
MYRRPTEPDAAGTALPSLSLCIRLKMRQMTDVQAAQRD